MPKIDLPKIDLTQFLYFIHKKNQHEQVESIGVLYEKENVIFGQIVYSDINARDVGKLWSETTNIIEKRIRMGIYDISKESEIK